MKFDKRIWKTGVAAAAITLVAGLFVMRLDEWSKGLNSGFIAYGQSGTGGGGNSGGGSTTSSCFGGSQSSGTSTATCVTKTVPHIVGGGGYTSIIEVINTGSATASIGATFYDTKGSVSTTAYSSNLNGQVTSFTGTLSPVSVPVNGVLVITMPSTGTSIQVNWGNVTSTSTMTVAEAFELRDGSNNLLSRTGVPASAPDMTSFVIPRFRNLTSGLDVGFAIANTGAATTVTVTMRNAAGNTVATAQLPIGKQSQINGFPRDFFPNLSTGDATGYGEITFVGGGAQLAAVGLAIEGPSLATFPVDRLQ